jgi:hypothetical protein
MNPKTKIAPLILMGFMSLKLTAQKPLALDKWQYIQADSSRQMWGDFDKPEWLRYYGLDFKDLNGDGYKDIIAGRYFYLNPAKDMTGLWQRTDLGLNVDACLFTNIDGDDKADAIGMAYPNVYWLEANDKYGSSWTSYKIGEVPRTDHVNGQGFRHVELVNKGKKEILLSAETGLYAAAIPAQPQDINNWKFTRIAPSFSDEGIGYGDIDGDGDIDIALGTSDKKGNVPNILNWFENPNHINGEWQKHFVGNTVNNIDRIEIADFDGDKKADIAVSEELYPGLEPVAHLYTFKNPANPKNDVWERKIHFTGYSNNNLDAADLDQDGDIDLVTGEHKGKEYPTLIFENDGKGNFTQRILDKGHESHLGTQLIDLDGDSDLDLVSTAWDNHKFLHVWRNDALLKKKSNSLKSPKKKGMVKKKS